MTQLLLHTKKFPPAGRYGLVVDHCVAELSVKHMVVKTAKGRFTPLGGELHVDADDPLTSWVRVDLDAASFWTGIAERDEVIVGPDFLDAAHFPVIRFESTFVDEAGDGRFRVVGDLFVRDLVGEVELDARLVHVGRGRVAFEATGALSRVGYGLTWSAAIERAGVVVSDTVKLHLAAEFAA